MKKKHKLIKIIGILLLSLVLVLAFILFTTSEKKLSKHKGSFVNVIGDVSILKQIAKDLVSNNNQGTMGGKDLCHPDSPFGECYPPEGSVWAGPRETLELELNEKQITDLINEFKPDLLLTSDVKLKFDGDTAIVETISYFPIAPGLVRAEIQITKHNYVVNKLYIGRIPASEKIKKALEESLDILIIDSLSAYGVTCSSIEIKNGLLYTKASVPSGLVQIDNDGVLIINANATQQQDKNKEPGDVHIL